MFTPGFTFGDDRDQKQIFNVYYFASVSGASKSLIILSDDLQPFLLSDSHQSFPRLIESSYSGLCCSAAYQVHCKGFVGMFLDMTLEG